MFLNTELWLRALLAIAVGFAVSFASTPIVKTFAQKVGAIDVPKDARRVHDHPIPRMGGLAIFLGFILSVVLFVDISRQVQGILLGAVLIAACGAIDDIISLRAWIKLIVQIVAAIVAVAHGVVIEVLMNPNIFSENEALILGVLAVPVTILWIVGITNSVNLIDGLDGLAVGVSTISSVTMFVVALLVAEGNVAVILAALMGACVGFMPYNFNPAKVFMGDTGSLFLGGAIVALAFAYDMPLILIVLGLMYIIETLSDIIQVGYFKLSHGKRVFKMAPFHHHLEMGGWTGKKWTERELFLLYFSISLVCAVISFVGVYSRYAF